MEFDDDFIIIDNTELFKEEVRELVYVNFLVSFHEEYKKDNKANIKDISIQDLNEDLLMEMDSLLSDKDLEYLIYCDFKTDKEPIEILAKLIQSCSLHMYVKLMNKLTDEGSYQLCWDSKNNDFIYKTSTC